jgi:hypothetical protein
MTAHEPDLTERTETTTPASPRRALVLAVGAAAALVALWYALSIWTGLVFHFMPGAAFVAATWVFRSQTPRRPATWVEVVVVVGTAGLLTAVGLVAVHAAGGALDRPAEIAAILIAGVAIAITWLRRPAARVRLRRVSPPSTGSHPARSPRSHEHGPAAPQRQGAPPVGRRSPLPGHRP